MSDTLQSHRGPYHWIQTLDRILRGETTNLASIRKGMTELPVLGLSVVLIALAAVYGGCMGWFGLFLRPDGAGIKQLFASMVKVPALFILTLAVTFPSLYVFNALVGSRLTMRSFVRLMVATMAVTLAVLASFGPIVAFFSVTTTSHPFILLLNVAFCAIAGFLGMSFLLQTLHRLSMSGDLAAERAERSTVDDAASMTLDETHGAEVVDEPAAMSTEAAPASPQSPAEQAMDTGESSVEPPKAAQASIDDGPLDALEGRMLGGHVKTVFRCWVVAFALVGSQMSWVLRPFIGKADEPFEWFGSRESNFFEAVWQAFQSLF